MDRARILMMMMMMLTHSSPTDQSLQCHHDYFNTFTCEWNISKLDLQPPITPDTKCILHAYVKKLSNIQNKSQELTVKSPQNPNILTASVDFNKKNGIIIGDAYVYQNVTCENSDYAVAQTQQHTAKESVVKVFPPVDVKVDGLNVSWSLGSPLRRKHQKFEFQFRSAEKSWMDVESINVMETHVTLQEDSLILDQLYVLRVRAIVIDQSTAVWSDWSTEYHWTSKVGKPRILPVPLIWMTLTGIVFALMLIYTVLFKYNKCKWLQKIHSSYIPDPSKYFTDLNSHHTGNFASWLGPAFALDHFVAVSSEFDSPVEVVKLQDAQDSRHIHKNVDVLRDGWDNTSKTSTFSNSTYFLSQSSNGPMGVLEPCSAHCSYGPARGNDDPGEILQNLPGHVLSEEENREKCELESSRKRLEQLRQDTQSPDSGFATGTEDSMEETELPSPDPNKHLLLSWEHMPFVPGPFRLIPDLDLKLLGSCGMIEPSTGDYMPVKNVQN